mmetsp:Transcript_30560/g.83984  ORF Transcript_30560/g.83984 Transcript_30560/m.83984 type:complete len:323 (-) Transcript_30560:1556-2524(-)
MPWARSKILSATFMGIPGGRQLGRSVASGTALRSLGCQTRRRKTLSSPSQSAASRHTHTPRFAACLAMLRKAQTESIRSSISVGSSASIPKVTTSRTSQSFHISSAFSRGVARFRIASMAAMRASSVEASGTFAGRAPRTRASLKRGSCHISAWLRASADKRLRSPSARALRPSSWVPSWSCARALSISASRAWLHQTRRSSVLEVASFKIRAKAWHWVRKLPKPAASSSTSRSWSSLPKAEQLAELEVKFNKRAKHFSRNASPDAQESSMDSMSKSRSSRLHNIGFWFEGAAERLISMSTALMRTSMGESIRNLLKARPCR